VILPREPFWFTCTTCADHVPASRLGGRFSQAGGEPICRDCLDLIAIPAVTQ